MINVYKEIYESIVFAKKASEKGVFCVAIDGGSASGKTTLAAELKEKLGACVIHCDDFFIPISSRDKVNAADLNLDFERFEKEVLQNLWGDFSYRPFDCKTQSFADEVLVKNTDLILIEGAYSHHPKIRKYVDLAIFLDISKDLQKQRILARNPKNAQAFFTRWIPLEDGYFQKYSIKENADLIVKIG